MTPLADTRYLRTSDGVYIAHQVLGEGPVDVAIGFNSDESNVDLIWDVPEWADFLTRLARFARVILHDRRSLGMSSRNVPPPNLETRVADLLRVLDAARSQRPILLAGGIEGAVHALFAATHPARVGGIVWFDPFARVARAPDYPWGRDEDEYAQSLSDAHAWGTIAYARSLAELREAQRRGLPRDELGPFNADLEWLRRYARVNRATATPDVADEILRIDWMTDVRAVLPSVQAPTVILSGSNDQLDEAGHIASLIPTATLRTVEGRAGMAMESILDAARDLGGIRTAPAAVETVLATVLFTDIVDATARQAALGDRAWKNLVMEHHTIVRQALSRWRGLENDTAGDGFYATFDGPARAIHCAIEVAERVRTLGVEVRAGIHTGECELIDGKCGGISVSIGARIAARAGKSEVLVSQTVKDLVAGSGLAFDDAGEHDLKGVPGRWHVYRVRPPDA